MELNCYSPIETVMRRTGPSSSVLNALGREFDQKTGRAAHFRALAVSPPNIYSRPPVERLYPKESSGIAFGC